jgi:chitodextrinase
VSHKVLGQETCSGTGSGPGQVTSTSCQKKGQIRQGTHVRGCRKDQRKGPVEKCPFKGESNKPGKAIIHSTRARTEKGWDKDWVRLNLVRSQGMGHDQSPGKQGKGLGSD